MTVDQEQQRKFLQHSPDLSRSFIPVRLFSNANVIVLVVSWGEIHCIVEDPGIVYSNPSV